MFKRFFIAALFILLGTIACDNQLQAMYYRDGFDCEDYEFAERIEQVAKINDLLNSNQLNEQMLERIIEAVLRVPNNSLQNACAKALIGPPIFFTCPLHDTLGFLDWVHISDDMDFFLEKLDDHNKRKILMFLCSKICPQFERWTTEEKESTSIVQLQNFFKASTTHTVGTNAAKELLQNMTVTLPAAIPIHPFKATLSSILLLAFVTKLCIVMNYDLSFSYFQSYQVFDIPYFLHQAIIPLTILAESAAVCQCLLVATAALAGGANRIKVVSGAVTAIMLLMFIHNINLI